MIPFRSFAALAAAFLALGAAASAHVTISPKTVAPGATTELTFRCPNERSAASTISLVVQLPPDAPLATVEPQPAPGWTVRVTQRDLATPLRTAHGDVKRVADTIAWTGGRIAPGGVATFAVRIGAFPAAPSLLTFKAVQTYDDGEVVRWIEDRAPGEPEPPNPAPAVAVR